jgi:lysozyme family protein
MMADANEAIQFTLRQEDSTLAGTITNISGDSGGMTRFGLVSKYHPTLVASGFYDASMDAATALPLAEAEYEAEYTTPLLIPQFASQAIATALTSFSVNEEGAGSRGRAVQILQEACQQLGQQLADDGAMGPATLAAINACEASALLPLYCQGQQTRYNAIVAADPTQQKFLRGWTARVDAIKALSTS